ncbi:nuclear pore complex protein NUP1-like isoform X2 [Hibiscus syriacus]|uniref:nuclear pore complex protein NUP1-like isoform X2 n=1 Tax=Hibiscus syriacus TaxID=106335 RepID=UPI00192456BB|nr:nuclear pore complex protein NUP1-like isoform X2 [Hibiscus syriacus]
MATPREESNPYDGGFGAGGKFRKRPFRRTTPYDRPPTAIRNPNGSGDRTGWLSKLVDPAQRLITYSAHRLFASFFRKRLTPSPPHPPEAPVSETNQEAKENSPAATSTVKPIWNVGNASNHADEGGVAELEEILKHKTFTRSEIDRLTSLLHSRTVDFPGENEYMVSKLKPVVSCDKEEKIPETPVRENGTENHLISNPVVCSTVLDEDVASPAELAKAYMGSRPQKASVSMLRSHNKVPMADSALLNNRSFPTKSPITSLVPRSGHVGSPGNGFVTPRSRGRSAIYSMAWTPYSRANSGVVLKGAGTASSAFGGPSSSSRSAWEQDRISGSTQGVLKRRSSVLDHDIGSIGPIRRIRQKSNILSSKHSILPVSANALSVHIADTSSADLNPLAEIGYNSTPGTSFTPVPSKSSEVASKILQQLDKLVSPGEKSCSKLSPSMLNGQSLKSPENVDSSKFLDMHANDKLSGSHMVLPDSHDSMSYNRDKAKRNGSTMLVALSDKSVHAMSGIDTGSLMNDNNEPNGKASDSTVIKSAIQPPQQKRRGFQMSANEDYLDLDDDGYPNGAASATLGKVSKGAAAAISVEKPKVATSSLPAALLASQSTSTAKEDSASEEPKVTSMLSIQEKVASAKQSDVATSIFRFASADVGEISSASEPSGAKLPASSDSKLENTSSFATTAAGTTNCLENKIENTPTGILFRPPETTISTSGSTSMSAGSIFKFDTSKNSSTLNNGSLASSPFSYTLPTPSLIPNNGQSSSFGSIKHVSSANSDPFDTATASTTANVTISSTSSSPSLDASVYLTTAAPVFKFASSGFPSAAVSTLSATSREAVEVKTQDTSSGNVGLFGSNSAFTSSGSNIFGGSSAVTGTSSTSGCTTAIITSAESSRPNDTSSNITNSGSGFFSSTNTVTNTGNGIFGGTSVNTDAGRSTFGSASLPIASTGSSTFSTKASISSTGSKIFGFSAPATSGSTMQAQGLNPFNAVNTQAFAAGTGFGTSTQSTPIQFSSSGSSSAVAGNTTFASGTSVFGSSASVAKPFGSGASSGMSFSASETNSLSSGSGIASGTFGSNWQAPKSPIFDSSTSSGFSFGSSASVTAPSTAPALFGSSTGASSNSIFSFTSAIVATPSQSVFGNTNPGLVLGSTPAAVAMPSQSVFVNTSPGLVFGSTPAAGATPSQNVFGNTSSGLVFGSTPSSNNDQMEDTMADDTAQTAPTVPTFGQPLISPPASGPPFGASYTAGATFQFGAQPTTSHNPSPFQASSSQEFGAGGSFSLGTSGGDKSTRRIVKVRRQRKK